jgi:hypothetical protein
MLDGCRRARGVVVYRWLFAALALLTSAAHAHDTWLIAEAPNAARDYWSVALTTGASFPALGSAAQTRRIARALSYFDGRSVPLLPAPANAQALPFRVVAADTPVITVVVSLHALDIALAPDLVATYVRDELGGEASVLERYRARGQWRERYTKNAKTIIRRAGGSPDVATTHAVGLPYELVPRVDPTLRAPGAALGVCARADGAALDGAFAPIHIGLVEADGSQAWRKADGDGCATFRPATTSGFLLRSVLLRPVERDDLDWESHFASLTVHSAAAPTPPTENSP